MIQTENVALGSDRRAIVQRPIGQRLGVLFGEAGGQHQLANIVQDAPGKSQFRISAGHLGQRPGRQANPDTMPDVRLRIETRAVIGPENTAHANGQHHAAHRPKAEDNHRFIDR